VVLGPWGLVSSTLIPFGVLHILFKTYALRIMGPCVEAWFGSAMLLLVFVVTAVGAALASNMLGDPGGISAGASGGVLGLIGIVAVAGHRDRSRFGEEVRNNALKWAGLTFALGLVVSRIDNVAHVAGFILGGLLGWVIPRVDQSVKQRWPSWVHGVVIVLSLGVLGFGFAGMIQNQLRARAFALCDEATREMSAKEALRECEAQLDVAPNQPLLYDRIAVLHVDLGDADAARKILGRAQERGLANVPSSTSLNLQDTTHNRCVSAVGRVLGHANESKHSPKESQQGLESFNKARLVFCEQAAAMYASASSETASGLYHDWILALSLLGQSDERKSACKEAEEALGDRRNDALRSVCEGL